MVKAILFDLDGTLLDTSPDIRKLLNECLSAYGLPGITPEEAKRFIGDGARKLVERAVKGRDDFVERVLSDYIPKFAVCDNSLTRLFDGEDEFLRFAKGRGIKLAVVTNKPQKATENVCRQYLSEYSFDCLIGAREGLPLKPDPEGALSTLDRFGLSPDEALFVGDGETDVETAGRAKVRCVSALWGYRTREHLEAYGAEEFAENFDSLKKYI
ncbi:MAG: HAD family hydrolase [Clostridia bacterium]|nr:HAD family hydrolase [Clostridia bacterium]